MHRAGVVVLVAVGFTITAVPAFMLFSAPGALVAVILLQGGPAWALAFCVASEESDFVGASWTRDRWLRVLPWTFVLAPLVVPNIFLIGMFLRDSRADGGRSFFTWDRMRPGEVGQDHHWPE